MRNKAIVPYLILCLSLLGLISLTKENGDNIKGKLSGFLQRPWQAASDIKVSLENFFRRFSYHSTSQIDEKAQLQIQTLLLKNQMLETEVKKMQSLLGEDLAEFFDFGFDCLPAQVIFRSHSTWNSALWLNVGSQDNNTSGKEIITKNSPVVIGTAVVGVIDQVEKFQSRIRLITDSGLRPSVRVKRSYGQQTCLLAKGEIFGSSQPLWKTEGLILQGIGFNYDFADEEGPARDLRTGRLIHDRSNKPAVPIIKVGDLLVTSGLDGIFPPGLDVATVTKIHPLKEGDFYYEIEAKPAAENLYDLSYVFVIPPLTKGI